MSVNSSNQNKLDKGNTTQTQENTATPTIPNPEFGFQFIQKDQVSNYRSSIVTTPVMSELVNLANFKEFKQIRLVYKWSLSDGSPAAFLRNCSIKDTLGLISVTNNDLIYNYGVYTTIAWEGSGGKKEDQGKSFIFSVKNQNIQVYNHLPANYEVWHGNDEILSFGGLYVRGNKTARTYLTSNYACPAGENRKTILAGGLNPDTVVNEIEVYQFLK